MKRILTLIFACCLLGFAGYAQISFTGYYHQDFDSLANSGTTSSTMPYGWHFYENGGTSTTTYTVDNGGANSGNTYSYGSTGSSDRALGTLASGTTQPMIGVAFTNKTGQSITKLRISYKIEQWRLGATGARPTDSMIAEINPFATSLDFTSPFAPWTEVSDLKIKSVVTSGTTGAIDGNNSSNFAVVTYVLTGVNVPNNQTIWLRWRDINISGSDDGIAIDSFTLEIPKPVVYFSDFKTSIKEGDSAKVVLSIKDPSNSATSVKVNVSSASTATVNTDYTYTSGTTYTFGANSISDIEFWIKTTDDSKIEKTENLILTLSDVTSGALLGDSIYTIVIADDDTIQVYDIEDVKFPLTNGKPDTTKYGVFHGVVIGPNFESGNSLLFSIKDSTGAITVANPFFNFGYTPAIGDSLFIRAKVADTFYTAVLFPDSISKINSGNSIPAPIVTTTLNDNNESDLVTLKNVKLVDVSKWGAASGSGAFYVQVTNGSKIFDVLVDENTSMFNRSAPKFNFDLTGVVLQYGLAGPTTGYVLVPRGDYDIMEYTYPLYKIAELKGVNSNGVPDSLNVRAWVKGVVQSPTYRANALEFSLQDNTGGIIIFNSNRTFGYTPKVGDSIMILGGVVNFNGLTELTLASADTVIFISSGTAIAAEEVEVFTERHEGSLVTLEEVWLVDATQWKLNSTDAGYNVQVTNGTDTFTVRIDRDVNLYNTNPPTGIFDVTGILTQFDNSSPYTTGYQLLPRNKGDIYVYPEYTIAELKPYNATTGVADSIGVKAWIRGTVSSENFEDDFFAMYDNTAGITILLEDVNYTAKRGDSIRVFGTIGQMDGLTYMEPDLFVVLNSGNTVAAANVVTTFTEADESELVQITNVTYAGSGPGDFFRVTDGTTEFLVLVANNINIADVTTPNSTIKIKGILTQMDSTSPYFSTYAIMPRDSMDVEVTVSVRELNYPQFISNIYPNPATTSVNVTSDFVADRIVIIDVTGKEIIRVVPVTSNENIDVSSLKPGVYMIQVQKHGLTATKKLYKQ